MKKCYARQGLLLFLLLGLFQRVHAQEINDQSFIGNWVGKWDKSYSFCLQISSLKTGSKVNYRWQEHPHGTFSRSQKKLKRINKNTLKLGNILLILDQEDPNKGLALGVFTYQSRQSQVIKKADFDSFCVVE